MRSKAATVRNMRVSLRRSSAHPGSDCNQRRPASAGGAGAVNGGVRRFGRPLSAPPRQGSVDRGPVPSDGSAHKWPADPRQRGQERAANEGHQRGGDPMRPTIAGLCALAALVGLASPASGQETIRLRIASGHPPANTYVNLMQNFFVPEASKRVAARTKHKLEFVEGYGGAMVKVADTLEGVQSGIIDVGGYCFCFEPSNLPLHAFQVMLPFGTMDPVRSVKLGRAVYDKVPFMSKVFEDRFNQHLLGLIADNGYNLGTNFEWSSVAELKGKKLAGAGLNLKWLEFAGAVPVQGSLPEAYTGLQTGVYSGWIMFPSGWINFKLYEQAKHYTEVGFGAITWHGLTINKARWARLPKEVQDILLEVGREYEARTGTVNAEAYPKQIEQLKQVGSVVKSVPDQVRIDWANSLKSWPQEKADELDKAGLPGSLVLKSALDEAEKLGHKWPVRYTVK
jgi:TRAP-type C4-dicarboxylate transport system substrate-binding protein